MYTSYHSESPLFLLQQYGTVLHTPCGNSHAVQQTVSLDKKELHQKGMFNKNTSLRNIQRWVWRSEVVSVSAQRKIGHCREY